MKRTGFSLVELMVVIFIAAVLLGVLLPAVRSAQVANADKQTMNNIRQMCLSLHACNDTYRKLPPAFDQFGQIKYPTSVHVHLMPFMEGDKIYRTFLEEGKGDTKAKMLPFISPIDPSAEKKGKEGIQNLAANLRVFTDKGFKTKYTENMPALAAVESGSAKFPQTFRDGTSNVIVFATKYGYCGENGGSRYASAPNTKYAAFFGQNAASVKANASDAKATFQLNPGAKQCLVSPLMAQSFTKKALLIGLADGSERAISPNISAEIWNRALQPNDGKTLPNDWESGKE